MESILASAVELVQSGPLLLDPVWFLTIVMLSYIIISENLPTGQFEDSILTVRQSLWFRQYGATEHNG